MRNTLTLLCFLMALPTLSACLYPEKETFKPYIEDSRDVQIPQWAHKDWYAEDWLSQHDGLRLVKGFYEGDILRDQYVDNKELPVLVVGPNFYHLSGYDKRRVVFTVDRVYGITESNLRGAFLLQDWKTKEFIGTYNRNGLRMQ